MKSVGISSEARYMRRMLAIICATVLLFSLTACGNNSADRHDISTSSEPNETVADENTGIVTTDDEVIAMVGEQSEPQITEEEDDIQKLIIEVGDKFFTATLYDNETVTTLIEMLPLTLNMSELNGNEKYYYLDDTLPTDSQRPSGIKEGDIMLYGNSCLVLFYESFSTSYSYTSIGHIDDPSGLAKALGRRSVEVTFRID